MSIICNTRCLNASLTGTQRYTQKILDSFPQTIEHIAPAPNLSRGMKGHLWEQFILPGKLKGNLLWSPSNSGPLSYKNQVVTIHDIVSIDHPEWFNKTYVKWYDYMLPRLCKKAAHIIAISEFTRQRIIDVFKVPESMITVIYNGADLEVSSIGNTMELALPFKKYVLSLGSLEPRKNIPMLLNAWDNVIKQLPDDVGLVVVGGAGNPKIFKDAGINKLPARVHFTGHVNDQYIHQLYSNALFFVYLSEYEGFGLPPLEAMTVGTPVIASNATALPEVVGDAGLLVNASSLSECETSILKLINNEQLRLDLSKKALIRAKSFSWKNTALQTWDTLQRFN
jgi:glycosyltransferase involved in cell wall biosynthesis